MTENQIKFLNLFFNEGESFCVSPNKFGYHSVDKMEEVMGLQSPNEYYGVQDTRENEILLMALNPIKGFREDLNVTAFRSFLVEVDFGDLITQRKYIDSMKMPYSCCIYSGNKSLHYGIVVDEDFENEESWRYVAEWILNIMEKADQKTKNPSRSIRFPDNNRIDGAGKKQTTISIGSRVKKEDLIKWLGQHDDLRPVYRGEKKTRSADRDITKVSPWVIRELSEGIDFSEGRSNRWYVIARDLGMAGFGYQEIEDYLDSFFEPERDFNRHEWKTTIKSAYRAAEGSR